MCCYRSLVFNCCFKALTFHKVVWWHIWCVVGCLEILLLQIFSWFWPWKRFENWSIFDEIIRRTKMCQIFGPPCTCVWAHYSTCTVCEEPWRKICHSKCCTFTPLFTLSCQWTEHMRRHCSTSHVFAVSRRRRNQLAPINASDTVKAHLVLGNQRLQDGPKSNPLT